MISFQLLQVIERPVDEVFLFLRDFSNMPLWNYYVQSVTKVSPGEIGEGTIYEQKRKHDHHLYKVITYDPPRLVEIELQPPGPLQQYGFELIPANNQTQVHYKWQVDLDKYKALKYVPKGMLKRWLLSFAKRHIFTRTIPAVERNFAKLKILLEKGEVTLQDGRHIVLPVDSRQSAVGSQ